MTKLDAEALDLVDRYLFAVRRSLPPDLGADVALELRTLIEDKLDERAGADRRPDVGDVIGLLREMGRPDEVGVRFQRGPGQLLGPRVYATFLRVMRYGLAGIGVLVALIATIWGATGHADPLSFSFWTSLVGLYVRLAGLLFIVSVVTLAFAERGRAPWLEALDEWDPRELPASPGPDEERASPVWLVLGIATMTFVALLVTVLGDWLGILVAQGPPPFDLRFISFRDLGVVVPRALVFLWCVTGIGINLAVLRAGAWPSWARWADVGLGLLTAVIAFQVVRLSPLAHGIVPGDLPVLRAAAPALQLLLRATPFALLFPPALAAVDLIRKPRTSTGLPDASTR
jgi:hypothetical protein